MRQYLSASEAAKKLGVNLTRIYSMRDQGIMRTYKNVDEKRPTRLFFKRDDVERMKKIMPKEKGKSTPCMPNEELDGDMMVTLREVGVMCRMMSKTVFAADKYGLLDSDDGMVSIDNVRSFMKQYLNNGNDFQKLLKVTGLCSRNVVTTRSKPEDMISDDAYTNLATSIILSAISDYKEILLHGKRFPMYRHENGKWVVDVETKESLEEFFRSRWFGVLSCGNVLGEDLINSIRAECMQTAVAG